MEAIYSSEKVCLHNYTALQLKRPHSSSGIGFRDQNSLQCSQYVASETFPLMETAWFAYPSIDPGATWT
jgi:hypothetical protein